jgi:hypothetical protein
VNPVIRIPEALDNIVSNILTARTAAEVEHHEQALDAYLRRPVAFRSTKAHHGQGTGTVYLMSPINGRSQAGQFFVNIVAHLFALAAKCVYVLEAFRTGRAAPKEWSSPTRRIDSLLLRQHDALFRADHFMATRGLPMCAYPRG